MTNSPRPLCPLYLLIPSQLSASFPLFGTSMTCEQGLKLSSGVNVPHRALGRFQAPASEIRLRILPLAFRIARFLRDRCGSTQR